MSVLEGDEVDEETRKMLLRKKGSRSLSEVWKHAWNELDVQDGEL